MGLFGLGHRTPTVGILFKQKVWSSIGLSGWKVLEYPGTNKHHSTPVSDMQQSGQPTAYQYQAMRVIALPVPMKIFQISNQG